MHSNEIGHKAIAGRRLPALPFALAVILCSRAFGATSNWIGPGSDFNTATNWDSGVPTDIAAFNTATPTSLTLVNPDPNLQLSVNVNGLTFNPGASAYTITVPATSVILSLNGPGIANNSNQTQSLVNDSVIQFANSATAGDAAIANNGAHIAFMNTSSAGSATITSGVGYTEFGDNSTAADATIINNATFSSSGSTFFAQNATAGQATIINNSGGATGSTFFEDTSSASSATITNNGGFLQFENNSTAAAASITNNSSGDTLFSDASSAGRATITINSGFLEFEGASSASSATIINSASVMFVAGSTGGNAAIINNGDGFVDITQLTSTGMTVGSIAGSGFYTLGANALTVGGNDMNTTVSGVISGVGGSLVKVGTGTLTLSGANTYTGATTINAGALNLTGSLAGDATVASGAGLTGTGGLGNLTNNGSVTPGVNGAGALTVASYSGSGTLNVAINGASSTALKVNGNANLTGGTMTITASNIALGRYDLLNAGSITGTFSTVNTPVIPSYFGETTEYTSTDVLLLIHTLSTFASLAQNTNQGTVASALDAAQLTATGEFATAITDLAPLPSSQAAEALNQLSGDSLASFQSVGLRSADIFSQQMNDRATPAGQTSIARLLTPVQLAYNGDAQNLDLPQQAPAPAYGLWSRGVGFFDHIKGDSSLGSPAANTTTGGFQAGYDFQPTDRVLLGFSGGYAKTSLTVDGRSSSGNTTSVQSGIYASYRPVTWFLNGSLAYTANDNTMARTIQFPGFSEEAGANFQSRVYTTFAEAGYTFRPRADSTVEPTLSLTQSRLTQDAFTETGAPGTGLSVDEQSVDSLVSAAGLRVARTLASHSSHPVTVGARAAWQHELGDIDNSISAQFTAAPDNSFTVQGTPRDRDAGVLGFDGRVNLSENLQAYADYAAALSSNETLNAIRGGLTLKW